MTKPSRLDTVEQLEITDRKQWRAWLKKNHGRNEGVWTIRWKQHTEKHVSYEDLVEEALCYGWIDSLPRKLDDDRTMLYFCPRKPKSVWSKLNKDRINKLIANGSMTKAGLSKIEAAKADGSWQTLDAVDAMVIPPDLKKAFAKNRKAKKYFDAFPPGSKKIILYWIGSAKTDKTRNSRIDKTIELAEKNIRAN